MSPAVRPKGSGANGEGQRTCWRCGAPIRWPGVRLVGHRAFCGEFCAITWLADDAARTAWTRMTLEMERRARGPSLPLKLHVARLVARLAQARLDRRLHAGPRSETLPWLWLPTRQGAMALLVALLALGVAGGPSTETRAMVPAVQPAPPPPASAPSVAAIIQPEAPPPPAIEAPQLPAPMPRPAAPRPRPLPKQTAADITRGNTALRQVAFTFDGGDQANVAHEILDILQARGIRSTVFLTGQFIRMYPEVVRRLVADGHEVGNHLDTHPHLTTYAQNHRQHTLPRVTREFVLGQLRRTAEAFRALTGQAMGPYWRAPYGEHNAEIRGWAAEAGFRHISWTRGAGAAEDLDTRDWVADRSSRIYRSREEIAARILEFGRGRAEGLNGGIVLMHLNTNRKTDRPHESLPEILKSLQAGGYRLVTVSELLAAAEPSERPASAGEARRNE
jgi:peptidoglycan/xylan/chitin deacetylase (PgdA/CDA1 family)